MIMMYHSNENIELTDKMNHSGHLLKQAKDIIVGAAKNSPTNMNLIKLTE